jgi:endonuclease/exonuclease/phosphatase family metal-dependent hydrolase
VGITAFVALAAPVAAAEQTLSLTTWNLQHMMSESRFEEWAAFCAPYGWNEAEVERQQAARPARLTYCDAHSGLLWPSETVRESAPIRTREAMAAKVAALRQWGAALDSDVYALQEVSDADAVARVFPRDRYDIFATDADIPQNIAFAVKKNGRARVVAIRQVDTLAKRDRAGRPVRPGLELVIEVGGRRLTLLNVHLKAGCRAHALDAPDLAGVRDPQRRADIEDACRVLRAQVPELEAWLEAQVAAGALPMILGDFNRDLAGELRRKMPARLDGSDPRGPASASTRMGSLLLEIGDDVPPGSRLWFVRAEVEARAKSVKLPDATRVDRVCHAGIDHFLVSIALAKTLEIDPKRLVAVGADYGDAAYGPDRVLPSDHCPLTLRLTWSSRP